MGPSQANRAGHGQGRRSLFKARGEEILLQAQKRSPARQHGQAVHLDIVRGRRNRRGRAAFFAIDQAYSSDSRRERRSWQETESRVTHLAKALLSRSAFGGACGASPPLCWVAMPEWPQQDGRVWGCRWRAVGGTRCTELGSFGKNVRSRSGCTRRRGRRKRRRRTQSWGSTRRSGSFAVRMLREGLD